MNEQLTHAPVSVVIPCYKASAFLERAVHSVVNQTLCPAELILIDDASPDAGKTKELIAKLEKKIANSSYEVTVTPVYLKENHGPGGARNAGWERATQPWIAFLDADDTWSINKIALQYKYLQRDDCIDLLAHGSSIRQSSEMEDLISEVKIASKVRRVTLSQMLFSNRLPTRSVMLRREIPLRFPEKTLSEDYSLWLQIIAAGYDVRLMDCSLAFTFRPEYSIGGASSQLWTQERGELEAFASLYRADSISFLTFLIVSGWSLLKFLRRFIIRASHSKA